jgi:two-component system chemotaxis response regulator CheY
MKPILLVDDSTTMLASLTGILSKVGYAFTTATDGHTAIAKVQGGLSPSLIITDYHMPGMNGVELITQLRRLTPTRFTPILVLTTDSQQEKRGAAKAAGATGWLVKPVDALALVQVVKQVVVNAA